MGDETNCSSYTRLAGLRRWPRPARGFRLSPARISVRRLRARLSTLLGLLGRYVRNLRLLTRGRVAAGSSSPPAAATGSSRRFLVGGHKASAGGGGGGKGAHQAAADNGSKAAARRPPCMRSNSFYARAVAECLEFIKGSNVVPPASPSPMAPPPHDTPRRGSRC
ncbi:unnamed protein product [Urochloa humidicola]